MPNDPNDKPEEGLGLTDQELAEHEYKLDKKFAKARKYISQGIPIKGFSDLLNEEVWLREILKDIENGSASIRSRALIMLGQYLGILSDKRKKSHRPVIEINED